MNKLPWKWKVDFGIDFEIQFIFAFFCNCYGDVILADAKNYIVSFFG